MPAIQLNVLRQSAAELAAIFGCPEEFIKKFHVFLDLYANRSQRPGHSGEPRSLLQSYNVPKPAMRQVMLALTEPASRHPNDALALCDLLWKQPFLEFRLTAAWILGKIQLESPQPLFERIQSWAEGCKDPQVLELLLKDGIESLSRQHPQQLISWIEQHLNTEAESTRKVGLTALSKLLNTPWFKDYPACFRLIQNLLRSIPPDLRNDILHIIAELASAAPSETAYILKKNLEIAASQDLAWLVRQSMNAFPEDERVILREALRRHRLTPFDE